MEMKHEDDRPQLGEAEAPNASPNNSRGPIIAVALGAAVIAVLIGLELFYIQAKA
jgi:hypothetical protein